MTFISNYQEIDSYGKTPKIKKTKLTFTAQDFEWSICDGCGSPYIETNCGYVCPECGLEPKVNYQPLRYDKPYREDSLSHAPLGNTQIGTKRERLSNSHSFKLEKMNKLQSIRDNDELIIEKARIEISRIFTYMNLPDSYKEIVIEKFKKIRSALRPGTKYRSPEKLIPICIYYTLKFQNVSINQSELLEISKISKKDFNTFKLQINQFLPEYKFRKRKEYILQKISEIMESLELDMLFYYQSKKILYRLWDIVKNTKDNVVAGLVSSITALCSYQDKITVNSICKILNIKMSTIQSQVKKKIFDNFKISGFVSLVKSAGILRKIMEKLELIESENTIVEVKFGNGVQIFNCYDNIEYYRYILQNSKKQLMFITLKKYLHLITGKADFLTNGKKLMDFQVEWLSPPKGPPIVV